MCLAAVYWSRTSRVVFAASRHDAADAEFDDAMIYEELSKPLAARTIETLQLSVPRAQEPFQLWSTAATKIQY
jgi:guanine deaminase